MTEKPLTPAVGYIRMSTDRQEESPARQRGEIERLAQREGYRILRWYEDHGLTGTESKNRPQFQQMLVDTQRGDFRAVLMYEQSRFSREDVFDAMVHWRQLRDNGVKLVTCQRGELRFDDLAGLITAMVGQHEARGESIRLAQRVLSGRERKARQGVHLTRTPYGFDREVLDETGKVVRRVHWSESFARPKTWTSRLVPSSDVDAVDGIRYAFQMTLEGKSLRSSAVELNRRGLRTSGGSYFNTSKLHRILTNPVYAGVLRFGYSPRGKFAQLADETIYVDQAHQGIVDMATFDAVQTALDSFGLVRGAASEPGRYLLSGLVFCKYCGRKMKGATFTNAAYSRGILRHYRCGVTGTGIDECSHHPTVNADDLERLVLKYVRDYILCDENHAELMEAARRLEAKRGQPCLEEQQLAEVRRKIERGTQNLALADAVDFDGIKRLLSSWREQEAKLLARLEQNGSTATARTGELIDAVANLAAVRDNLHLANRVTLTAALRHSVSRITISKDFRRRGFTTLKTTEGVIEFEPLLTSRGPITFYDWDLNPEVPYYRLASYVRQAGRPVLLTELEEALALKSPGYHARRATLAGLVHYVPNVGWSVIG